MRIIIVVSCVSGSVTVVSVLQCPSMIVGDQVIVDVSVVGWVTGVVGVLLACVYAYVINLHKILQVFGIRK